MSTPGPREPGMERGQAELAEALSRVPRRMSIRTQLVALVLAIAVPTTVLVAYGIFDAANEARNAAYHRVNVLASFTAARLDNLLRDQERLLAALAKRPRIRDMDPRTIDPVIRELVLIHPEFNNLGLRDRNAENIYSFRPNPSDAGEAREFPWFREGIARGRFTAGDAFAGRLSGRTVTVLTYPVRDGAGEVTGLLNLSYDLLRLQERILRDTPPDALVVVLDRHDRYLLRSSDIERLVGKPVPEPVAAQIRGLRDGLHELTGTDGVRRIFSLATVPVSGWRVFAGLPVDTFLAPHRERLARSAAAGALVLLLALALAYRIGSAIARPINRLARAASEIAEGRSVAHEPDTFTAEVEIVANEFNRLAHERERVRGERAALVDHYERLLKSTRDIYLLTDGAGRIVDCNDVAADSYGYGLDELKGMTIADLRAPAERAGVDAQWQRASQPGGALFETVHQRRDGATFPVEVSASVIEIDGRPFRQGRIRDIGARKAAEEVLRRQNEDLDRFNRAAVGR
ncbi:MAG: PAS domain S-box protein, partial [Lysobacter sp.]|nr:PAS domain S-box protein [Lysobacter sp.]